MLLLLLLSILFLDFFTKMFGENDRTEHSRPDNFQRYSGTRFYDRRSNDIPDLTINMLCPGKSHL